MLKMVVLPAPFGPMRALMLPSGISNETSRTACRPRKDFATLRTSSSAIGTPLSSFHDELDERHDRDDEEQGIEGEEIDADVALAAAEHARLHERLVDRVHRPEDRRDQGEGASFKKKKREEQRCGNERGERPGDEECECLEDAHDLRSRPSARAAAGQMPCGRNMITASSTTP